MGRPGLGASRRTWTRCSSPTPSAPTSPRASSPSPRNSSRRSTLTTRPRYALRFWRKGSSMSLARRGRCSCPASSAMPSHLCRPARRMASTPTTMTREEGAISGRRRSTTGRAAGGVLQVTGLQLLRLQFKDQKLKQHFFYASTRFKLAGT